MRDEARRVAANIAKLLELVLRLTLVPVAITARFIWLVAS
jgi:hypothetical protein